MKSGQRRDGGLGGKEHLVAGARQGTRPGGAGGEGRGAGTGEGRARSRWVGALGSPPPSLTCMPGVTARRLQALGAARGWGVAEAGGAPGMVGRFAWQRGAGAGGGRAPGARGGGDGGRCSLRLGSAGLGRARLGSAGD